MISRRDFLVSSLLASGASFASGLRVGTAPVRDVRILTEANGAQARRFAERLAGAIDVLQTDPLDSLVAFERALADDACRAVFGLTRDSNAFLLTQIAARYGYRITYRGTHDVCGDGVRHTLQGDARSLEELATALGARAGDWPATLADMSPTLVDASASKLRRTLELDAVPDVDDLPYLTSWTLRRV